MFPVTRQRLSFLLSTSWYQVPDTPKNAPSKRRRCSHRNGFAKVLRRRLSRTALLNIRQFQKRSFVRQYIRECTTGASSAERMERCLFERGYSSSCLDSKPGSIARTAACVRSETL